MLTLSRWISSDFVSCLAHCSFEHSHNTNTDNSEDRGSCKEHFNDESKLIAALW